MHRPFAILEQLVKEGRIRLAEPQTEPSPPEILERTPDPPADLTDAELFEAAMEEVRPLAWNEGPARSPRPVEIRSSGTEKEVSENVALKILAEFCRNGRVLPEHTREYVEHFAHPIGRLYLDDLRSGRFAIQAHLDLHGLTLDHARPVVDAFIQESVRAGYSCVRVVPGRGRHSGDKRPLMKENVERWLRQRRLSRFVIAYTSARLEDGGGGAVYVLLRRA